MQTSEVIAWSVWTLERNRQLLVQNTPNDSWSGVHARL